MGRATGAGCGDQSGGGGGVGESACPRIRCGLSLLTTKPALFTHPPLPCPPTTQLHTRYTHALALNPLLLFFLSPLSSLHRAIAGQTARTTPPSSRQLPSYLTASLAYSSATKLLLRAAKTDHFFFGHPHHILTPARPPLPCASPPLPTPTRTPAATCLKSNP